MKPKNFKWRKAARQKRAGLDVQTSKIPKDTKIRMGAKQRILPVGDILNKHPGTK